MDSMGLATVQVTREYCAEVCKNPSDPSCTLRGFPFIIPSQLFLQAALPDGQPGR